MIHKFIIVAQQNGRKNANLFKPYDLQALQLLKLSHMKTSLKLNLKNIKMLLMFL